MDIKTISAVIAEASNLPEGNTGGMRISLPGTLSHAHRALIEMSRPFEDAPEHVLQERDDRIAEVQPAFHGHSLECLISHIGLLKQAFETGDAQRVRQFFDLYVFD